MKSRRLSILVLSAALAACPLLFGGEPKPAGGGVGAAAEGGNAGAGGAPAVPAAPGAATITRVYSVRDLVTDLPNFPATPNALPGRPNRNSFGSFGTDAQGGLLGSSAATPPGGMAGGGGGAGAGAAGEPLGGAPATGMGGGPGVPLSRADELVRLIEETVTPSDWRDQGGQMGGIRFFNGALVITHTAEAHNQIRKLLTDLRGDQSAMVRIRARWVLLKPADFDRVVKENDGGGGGGGGIGTAGAGGGSVRAARSVLQEVNLAELDKVAAHSIQFRAQTTCFSGQTVSVASGRQKSVISTVEAVVGTDVGAYQPTVGYLNSGLTLQVKPTFNIEDHTVVMTIDSTFTGPAETSPAMAGQLIAPSTQPAGAALEGIGLEGIGTMQRLPVMGKLFVQHSGVADASGIIDRINAVSQNLRTSVRVPLDKNVLIGGMTLEPANNGEDSPQLYLIIEASASM